MCELIENAGVQSVKVRSVLTCEAKVGVCGACYGRDLARGTPVNIGEAVGVIAAQSIGEPGTQLTMRTFHIGGTAQVAEQSFFESDQRRRRPRSPAATPSSTPHGDLIVMSRNLSLTIQVDGKDRETYKPPYGARLRVKDGEKVKRGQRLAEWDPYTTPIITEVGGKVRFEDLVEDLSVREEADEATGISNRVVIDWRASHQGFGPASGHGGDRRRRRLQAHLQRRRRPLPAAGRRHSLGRRRRRGEAGRGHGPYPDRKRQDPRHHRRSAAGGRAVRSPPSEGLRGHRRDGRPRRIRARLQEQAPHQDHPGGRRRAPVEFLIPKGKHISVHDGDLIRKGEYIIDGNPDPHDILRILGIEALAEFLVNEIQEVYRLQGVPINDKHIETIVRQMLQKVEILEPGDTGLIKGDHLDKPEVDEENDKAEARGGRPAITQPVLLGITKASLQTRSFISAASFQETTRVLTDASVHGKIDTLEGLKENVIVGRLIPAGTGSYLRNLQRIAAKRDEALTASREEAMEPLPEDIAVAAEAEKVEGLIELQSVSVTERPGSDPGPFCVCGLWRQTVAERIVGGRLVAARSVACADGASAGRAGDATARRRSPEGSAPRACERGRAGACACSGQSASLRARARLAEQSRACAASTCRRPAG